MALVTVSVKLEETEIKDAQLVSGLDLDAISNALSWNTVNISDGQINKDGQYVLTIDADEFNNAALNLTGPAKIAATCVAGQIDMDIEDLCIMEKASKIINHKDGQVTVEFEGTFRA